MGEIEIVNGYIFRYGIDHQNIVWGEVMGPGGTWVTGFELDSYPGKTPQEAAEVAEVSLIARGVVHMSDVSDEWKAEHPEVRGYGEVS